MRTSIETFCDRFDPKKNANNNAGNLAGPLGAGGNIAEKLAASLNSPDTLQFGVVVDNNAPLPDKTECIKQMTLILNGCDGNSPENPLNWKHGGANQVQYLRYTITPEKKKYRHGTCHMHIKEDVKMNGGGRATLPPETRIRVDIEDSKGNHIGDTGGKSLLFDQNKAAAVDGLYGQLEFTRGRKADDYIEVKIGANVWKTNDPESKDRKCNVGGWDSSSQQKGRDMDCWFPC